MADARGGHHGLLLHPRGTLHRKNRPLRQPVHPGADRCPHGPPLPRQGHQRLDPRPDLRPARPLYSRRGPPPSRGGTGGGPHDGEPQRVQQGVFRPAQSRGGVRQRDRHVQRPLALRAPAAGDAPAGDGTGGLGGIQPAFQRLRGGQYAHQELRGGLPPRPGADAAPDYRTAPGDLCHVRPLQRRQGSQGTAAGAAVWGDPGDHPAAPGGRASLCQFHYGEPPARL
mmetsp:Transcript_47438/g.92580  ORF Transcript_47438/g.92580 Transcript_47438/m.92580 type:complete len:226 (+) Transcript_47438:1454-2131(+)